MSNAHGEHAYRHMVRGPHPHAHHVGLYWAIFAILVGLTGLTVFLADFDFGSLSVLVTLLIAGTKASLVLGVFMHLYFDNKFYTLVIAVSFVFLSLFILFPIMDMGSRDMVDPVRGNFGPRDEQVFEHEQKNRNNPDALPLRPGLKEGKREDLVFEGAHH